MEAEIWKPIAAYAGLYEVSNAGRVRSLDRQVWSSDGRTWIAKGRELVLDDNHNGGYLTCQLSRDGKATRFLVHRLVAIEFIENPLCLPEVNHADGNKHHNAVGNLEWALRKDNIDHAVATQLINNKGENNAMAKTTADVVLLAKQLRARGYARQAISQMTGITVGNLGNIFGGKSWKHIQLTPQNAPAAA